MRFFPDLIKQGHIYCACPPLFKLKANKDVFYLASEQDLNEKLMQIISKKHHFNLDIKTLCLIKEVLEQKKTI